MNLPKGGDDGVDHQMMDEAAGQGARKPVDGSAEADGAALEGQLVPFKEDGAYEVSRVHSMLIEALIRCRTRTAIQQRWAC